MTANPLCPQGPAPGAASDLPVAFESPASRLAQSRAAFLLVSLLLLVPCYWQPRVEGGDLTSRIYNSWFARYIESGKPQGEFLVPHTTNMLFDAMLRGLFRVLGPEMAQRVAVSIAVLVFIWGAFAFASAVAGRRPWHLMPSIAMLAYGWVYHMGFFNFYLGLGLCFWALSLAWRSEPRQWAKIAPLMVLAYVAHTLPVVWTLCLLLYLGAAKHMTPARRAMVTAGTLLVMVAVHGLIGRTMLAQWSVRRLAMTTGADQVWVFDGKYYLVLAGLLAVWGLLFLELLHSSGRWPVVSGIPFQFCAISAAGVFILPTTILLPGLNHSLVFIAERMSLGVGICVCALLGAARPRFLERCALVGVALIFFGFLYFDERTQNSIQDRMQDTVARLSVAPRPAGIADMSFGSGKRSMP